MWMPDKKNCCSCCNFFSHEILKNINVCLVFYNSFVARFFLCGSMSYLCCYLCWWAAPACWSACAACPSSSLPDWPHWRMPAPFPLHKLTIYWPHWRMPAVSPLHKYTYNLLMKLKNACSLSSAQINKQSIDGIEEFLLPLLCTNIQSIDDIEECLLPLRCTNKQSINGIEECLLPLLCTNKIFLSPSQIIKSFKNKCIIDFL